MDRIRFVAHCAIALAVVTALLCFDYATAVTGNLDLVVLQVLWTVVRIGPVVGILLYLLRGEWDEIQFRRAVKSWSHQGA